MNNPQNFLITNPFLIRDRQGTVAFGHVTAPRVGRSPEEHVEKTVGYFRSLPVTARLRSTFFITLGGPHAHGHSFNVVGQAIAFRGLFPQACP